MIDVIYYWTGQRRSRRRTGHGLVFVPKYLPTYLPYLSKAVPGGMSLTLHPTMQAWSITPLAALEGMAGRWYLYDG